MVGSHLLKDLILKGEEVRAIYREEKSLKSVRDLFCLYDLEGAKWFEKIEWLQSDICDIPTLEIAFEKVTEVYHCAALISFDPGDFQNLRKTNVEGTANIVNLCIYNRVKKLCFVSSISTLSKKSGVVVTEDNEANMAQLNVYGLTKFLGELEVWRGSQEGIPVLIVNPGVIIGPGFWDSGSGLLIKEGAKGMKFYPPGSTGFISVGDVVALMIKLMNSPIVNERFLLVAENLSYRELFQKMAKSFKQKPPQKELKFWLLEIFWRLDWIKAHFFKGKRNLTKARVMGMRNPVAYSSEKIRDTVEHQFEDFDCSLDFSCSAYQRYLEESS